MSPPGFCRLRPGDAALEPAGRHPSSKLRPADEVTFTFCFLFEHAEKLSSQHRPGLCRERVLEGAVDERRQSLGHAALQALLQGLESRCRSRALKLFAACDV